MSSPADANLGRVDPNCPSENTVLAPGGPALLYIGLIAACATAVDIVLSLDMGILSHPPVYDGVGYTVNASRLFWLLSEAWSTPQRLWDALLIEQTIPLRAPIWQGLMVAHFFVLGEGEWQAYSVRFWPSFLLAVLAYRIVRKRASLSLSILAAGLSLLLPTSSVGIRAAAAEYVSGIPDFGRWYLADLRPDLLSAVGLAWLVHVLLDGAEDATPTRRSGLLSGVVAALTVMTKPTAFPIVGLAWGLAWAFIALRSRPSHRWMLPAALSLIPFLVIAGPWGAAGGVSWAASYLLEGLTAGQSAYADPDATLLSELGYYWAWYPRHMGPVLCWVPAVAAVVAIRGRWAREITLRGPLLAQMCIVLAIFAVVALTPNKNFFIGLQFYILLWTLSWWALAQRAARHPDVRRDLGLSVMAAVGAVGVFGLALLGWSAPVRIDRVAALENRGEVRRMAQDLAEVLGPEDCFAYFPAFGNPDTLRYYMTRGKQASASPIRVETAADESPEEQAARALAHCDAALVLREPVHDLARFFYSHPELHPFFQAIADRVRDPRFGFTRTREYRLTIVPAFSRSSADGTLFHVDLYARRPRSESVNRERLDQRAAGRTSSIQRLGEP